MASLVDSEAQFSQRLDDFKILAGIKNKLHFAGIKTFAVLVYSHGQPGQLINDTEFETWFHQNLENNARLSDVAGIKRLLFEAQTLLLASLKEQITASETTVKKAPGAERDARMKVVKAQLTGLLIEGSLEHAHVLLDMTASMSQLNEIIYPLRKLCLGSMKSCTRSRQLSSLTSLQIL